MHFFSALKIECVTKRLCKFLSCSYVMIKNNFTTFLSYLKSLLASWKKKKNFIIQLYIF